MNTDKGYVAQISNKIKNLIKKVAILRQYFVYDKCLVFRLYFVYDKCLVFRLYFLGVN